MSESPSKYACYMFINQRLKLKPGKIAVQTAHAMRMLMNNLQDQSITVRDNWKEWEAEGCKTVCLKIANESEMEEIYNSYQSIVVSDAGRTQCIPNSKTVLALFPKRIHDFPHSLY